LSGSCIRDDDLVRLGCGVNRGPGEALDDSVVHGSVDWW
jgi:hypothetical protein